jgi:guanylate kinase
VSSEPFQDPARANGPLLVVITGPSGVGKDTIVARLKELHPECFVIVTATTRPPREGERHGVDYLFMDRAEYHQMLAAGEFLEHAEVYGNRYGIPRAPVRAALAQGRDVLMRIDPQGAATVGRLVPGATRIFVAPPTMEELALRLHNRKTDSPEALARRLATARAEMERAAEFEYYVVNADGELDRTVCEITAIMTAERRRIHRPRVEV